MLVDPPPLRPRVGREREPPLREREPVLRFAVLRGDFAAPPELFAAVERLAVERFAAGLRDAEERVAAPVDDFARDELDERFAVERLAVERFAVERGELFLAGRDEDEVEPPLALALPSIVHLPLMIRCAASATASAISDPSFVALEATLLAAC